MSETPAREKLVNPAREKPEVSTREKLEIPARETPKTLAREKPESLSRENPSAVRSRRLITHALLELMAAKPLSRITVGEVCERAELTRPTFYNHFNTKEAVLEGVIDELFDEFISSLDESNFASTNEMIRSYFAFWEEREALLKLFVDNNLFSLMGDRFGRHLNSIYRSIPFKDGSVTSDELAYHNAFLSSGMAGMLKHWAFAGMRPDSREVARYVARVLAVLQAGTVYEDAPACPKDRQD